MQIGWFAIAFQQSMYFHRAVIVFSRALVHWQMEKLLFCCCKIALFLFVTCLVKLKQAEHLKAETLQGLSIIFSRTFYLKHMAMLSHQQTETSDLIAGKQLIWLQYKTIDISCRLPQCFAQLRLALFLMSLNRCWFMIVLLSMRLNNVWLRCVVKYMVLICAKVLRRVILTVTCY